MLCVVVLGGRQKAGVEYRGKPLNLVHRLLVRKFAVTLGALETVFCLMVLGNYQQVRV